MIGLVVNQLAPGDTTAILQASMPRALACAGALDSDFERRILAARLGYCPVGYEEVCLREQNWLTLLLQMRERGCVCPHGIEAYVVIVMLHDRARHLRN